MMAYLVVAALLTISPGPDTMLVLRNVLRGGRRDGVSTTLGVCSGLGIHALLSALGLSVILLHWAAAFQVVKAAGAAYLVWLGLQSLRAATRAPERLATVTGANLFTEPYLLTGGGGPNGASASPVLLMYQRGIEQGSPDVAAAIGVILVIGVLILAFIQRKLAGGDES